jgi:hypothetical protein
MATFLEAATQVLRASGRPLTVREIVEEAIRAGLLASNGKTPESTMSAALYEAAQRANSSPLRRIAIEGNQRAIRGSVRWALSK